MKRVILFLLVLNSCLSYGQENKGLNQNDSNIARLNGYIDNYLAMTPLNMDSLIIASDYLIAFSKDSLIKSHIAQYLFENFYNSKLMGMESVAIHIAKNYYLNGKLEWPNKEGLIMLRLYVDFNESSLLGMDAPALNLEDLSGTIIPLRDIESAYTIVLFFNDQCQTCKLLLPKLKEVVEQYKSEGVKVYAVFTESQKESYRKFIEQEFPDTTLRKEWLFVLDPLFVSNFHKLYNVIKTPQVFLLDKRKIIIGRNLDSQALQQLLKNDISLKKNLNKDIVNFVQTYLTNFNLSDTTELKSAYDLLFNKCIAGNNSDIYNSIFLELFDFLWRSSDDVLENAAIYLGVNYIIPHINLWWDKTIPADYVPRIINRIKTNKIGAIVNDFTFYTKENKTVKISEIKSKYIILYFYSPSCAICKPFSMELNLIYKSLKKRGAKIVAIDLSTDYSDFVNYEQNYKYPWLSLWIGENNRLDFYYSYQTEEVPMIYLLDKKKHIIAKKINTITLDKLLK